MYKDHSIEIERFLNNEMDVSERLAFENRSNADRLLFEEIQVERYLRSLTEYNQSRLELASPSALPASIANKLQQSMPLITTVESGHRFSTFVWLLVIVLLLSLGSYYVIVTNNQGENTLPPKENATISQPPSIPPPTVVPSAAGQASPKTEMGVSKQMTLRKPKNTKSRVDTSQATKVRKIPVFEEGIHGKAIIK